VLSSFVSKWILGDYDDVRIRRASTDLSDSPCNLPIISSPASSAGGTLETCAVMIFCRCSSLYLGCSSTAKNASQIWLTLVSICFCDSTDLSTTSLAFNVSLYMVSDTSSFLPSLALALWMEKASHLNCARSRSRCSIRLIWLMITASQERLEVLLGFDASPYRSEYKRSWVDGFQIASRHL
jgi:hypothetical protein